MTETKLCARCHIRKEVGDFYADKRSRDGRRSYCKACDMAAIKESRKNIKKMQEDGLKVVEDEYQQSLDL